MTRAIGAVVVGYLVWTMLWLGGNALFLTDVRAAVDTGTRFTAVGPLAGAVVLSLACSLVAGAAAARVAGRYASGATLILATLLLMTGIGVQAGIWPLMPVWYHLAFLALILPATIVGGRLGVTVR